LCFPPADCFANRVTKRCGEKVRHNAKANCPSRLNISCAIAWQWIRVVDDERLFALQASCEQELLSMPSPQHVQTDANMALEEMLAVEGSLTGTLNSNENYGFHRMLQTRRACSLSGALAILVACEAGRRGAQIRPRAHTPVEPLRARIATIDRPAHISASDEFGRKHQLLPEDS